MTPFQQLRLWLRRASIGQRITALVATAVAVALVALLIAPLTDDDIAPQSLDTTGTTAPGQLASGGGLGEIPTGVSGSNGQPNGSPTGSPTGGTGSNGQSVNNSTQTTIKQCPATVDQGTTASDIKVAITIINIAGAAGNDALNVPSPQEQREDWQWVADAINREGGAACRKIVPTFYDVNPINADDIQRKCFAIVDSKPFLAIDTGALTGGLGSADCIPQNKVPLVSQALSQEQLTKFYPYYISTNDLVDNSIRDGVLAMKKDGYFDASRGFKKLGIVYRTCRPNLIAIERKTLAQAGVAGAQIVEYNLGCPPSGSNTAADYQQAVLAFQNAGASHVTEVNVGDFGSFSKAAARQDYKPVYILNDSGLNATSDSSGSYPPDPENFNGAINYVNSRFGENTTPGYVPNGGTAKCNAIFTAKGRPTVYKQGVGYGGVVCGFLWTVAAMIDRVSELKRSTLLAGLNRVGTLDAPFPLGPTNFSAVPAGSAYGRGFYRATKYVQGCACWQVPSPEFLPGFP